MDPKVRYVNHRKLDRVRYSPNLLNWLKAQSTRLAITVAVLWSMLLGGKTFEEIEATTASTAPVNTVAPTISGTTTSGSTLTANDGTWTGTPTPTFTYQWNRGGVNIAGATAKTYVLVAGDVGATITVTVTGTNTAGNASATSAGVGPIT